MTNKIKKTLEKTLIEAGRILKCGIDRPKNIQYKSPVSLVTETDKKAEQTIIEIIKHQFPDHSILSEESPPYFPRSATPPHYAADAPSSLAQKRGGSASGGKWIIDPLDGTANFAHSFHAACVSIAYEDAGILKLGGVWNPFINEWFWAERGKGASLNGKKIHVSKMKSLRESLLVTGFPYDRVQYADYYLKFMKAFMMTTHGIRRLGSAALDLCYVACGRFDGYWEFKLNSWDQAAGALIVEEAGGKLSDFRGKPMNIYGQQTLATNGKIHGEMLKILKKHL